MCLLLLSLHTVPHRPWLLLGNRDEFHARPTAPANQWEDAPGVIGGRDLKAGGSWLALHRNGRYAAVTNVRNGMPSPALRSRGKLVGGFVMGAESPEIFVKHVAAHVDDYGPFNLVVGDNDSAWLLSSIDAMPQRLGAGTHLFSNGLPANEWPKMRRLRKAFDTTIKSKEIDNAALLDLLEDETGAADADLPDTGVGIELERRLAPIFIRGETYGTRASTLAWADIDGSHTLIERRFGPNAQPLGESTLHF